MPLEVIDYSQVYYEVLRQSSVPPQRGGKLIVVRHGKARYAAFSPAGLSEFHANILERFLSERGVGGHYNDQLDHFYADDPTWQIEGGAHWSLDESQRVLRLRGKSIAYGPINLPALAQELRELCAFGGAEVIVSAAKPASR